MVGLQTMPLRNFTNAHPRGEASQQQSEPLHLQAIADCASAARRL